MPHNLLLITKTLFLLGFISVVFSFIFFEYVEHLKGNMTSNTADSSQSAPLNLVDALDQEYATKIDDPFLTRQSLREDEMAMFAINGSLADVGVNESSGGVSPKNKPKTFSDKKDDVTAQNKDSETPQLGLFSSSLVNGNATTVPGTVPQVNPLTEDNNSISEGQDQKKSNTEIDKLIELSDGSSAAINEGLVKSYDVTDLLEGEEDLMSFAFGPSAGLVSASANDLAEICGHNHHH